MLCSSTNVVVWIGVEGRLVGTLAPHSMRNTISVVNHTQMRLDVYIQAPSVQLSTDFIVSVNVTQCRVRHQ